ncbi:MAG: insulinase family protein [Gemmatimonadetes bacterium]|nr:insulinase family protein [Gemmatimonadota bacterium]
MFPPDEVVRHVLPNGLTLLVRHDRTAPVVAIVTYVKAGYFDEPDEVSGIAHVLEHMFFKGTPTRGVGEIARQTKACGGYLNASTIYDHTRYYAVVPSGSFAEALEIQADAWANATLDGDELARELEVIIEEARRKADTPEAVTTETLFELMYDAHRMRRWRIGHPEVLRALRHEHLRSFYRQYYQPSNTVLCVVGDVPVATVIREVERRYGAVADVPVVRDRGPGDAVRAEQRFRALRGDITQAHGAFGWRAPAVHEPASVHLDIAATVLASGRSAHLYRAVRERRLASSVSAWNYTPGDLGVFVVQWSGPVGTTDDAARAAWATVHQLPDRLRPRELERARRLHASRTLRRLESMDGQANYLVDWEALGSWTLGAAYEAALVEATVADVGTAVAAHLAAGSASWLRYDPVSAPTAPATAAAAFGSLSSAAFDLPDPAPVTDPAPQPRVVVREGSVVADVHLFRTPGGVPILVRRVPGAPMVHMGLHARGGASADPEGGEGMALLMARTALKGTNRRDAQAVASDGEMAGGSINASITADGLGWGISVPAAQWADALDLLADVVTQPRFDGDALETERAIAVQQLAQARDDMYRHPTRLALAAAFAGHPYGRSAMGSEAGLTAATVAQVREMHRVLVLEGDVVLGVIGDVDPIDVASRASGWLSSLAWSARPPIEAPTWYGVGQQVVEPRDKSQTAIMLAFPGPSRRDATRFTAQVLSAVTSGLGGRFFDALREKRSLAYTVHAGPALRARAGLFTAYIATSPSREDEARQGLLAEFARLRQEPVAEDELARARRYTVGTHAISRQSPSAVLDDMLDAWVHGTGLEEMADVPAQLARVTSADILELARACFDPDRRVEGIVRGRQA